MNECFECGANAEELHHVVPRSKGGTKTVPLCCECHGKVHDVKRISISQLSKEGLAKKKAQGYVLGRPMAIKPEVRERIVEMRKSGMILRGIAETLNSEGIECTPGKKFYLTTIQRILQQEARR